jgi:hypothetical protein
MATLQSGSFSFNFPSQLSSLCLPVPGQRFPLLPLKVNHFSIEDFLDNFFAGYYPKA